MNRRREAILGWIATGFPGNLALLALLVFGIVSIMTRAKDAADLVFALAALAATCAVTVALRRRYNWFCLPTAIAKSLGTIFGLVALFCLARYAWSEAFDGHRATWGAIENYSHILLIVVGFSHMALAFAAPALGFYSSSEREKNKCFSPKQMRVNRVFGIVVWLCMSADMLARVFAYDIAAAILIAATIAIGGAWLVVGLLVNRKRAARDMTEKGEPSPYLVLLLALCTPIAARLLWWLIVEGQGSLRIHLMTRLAFHTAYCVIPAYLAFHFIKMGPRWGRTATYGEEENINSSMARSG